MLSSRIVAGIQGVAGVLFAPTMTFHKQVDLCVSFSFTVRRRLRLRLFMLSKHSATELIPSSIIILN